MWAGVVTGGVTRLPCGVTRDSSSNPTGLRTRPASAVGLTARCGPSLGHSSRTKSVIRASSIFPPEMVTGEFYARVTTRWVTAASRTAEVFQDKRPACTWLRSSRRNSADQSMTVIKSLCKNFASPGAVAGQLQKRQFGHSCLIGGISQREKFAGSYYRSVRFSPIGRTAA